MVASQKNRKKESYTMLHDVLGKHRHYIVSGSLQGKTVLLTGATGGIGSVIAEFLARAGARLILLGRNTEKLQEFVQRLPSVAPLVIARYDAADSIEYVQDLLATIAEEYGQLDGLINCAGCCICLGVGIPESDSRYQQDMLVNYRAPKDLTRTQVDIHTAFRFERPLRIVNITSQAAHLPLETSAFPAYSRAKACLNRLTRELAEYEGVFSFGVSPMKVYTDMVESVLACGDQEVVRRWNDMYPLDWAAAEETAFMVYQLLVGEVDVLSGRTITVDHSLPGLVHFFSDIAKGDCLWPTQDVAGDCVFRDFSCYGQWGIVRNHPGLAAHIDRIIEGEPDGRWRVLKGPQYNLYLVKKTEGNKISCKIFYAIENPPPE